MPSYDTAVDAANAAKTTGAVLRDGAASTSSPPAWQTLVAKFAPGNVGAAGIQFEPARDAQTREQLLTLRLLRLQARAMTGTRSSFRILVCGG